jgi:hypothetical protein
MRAYDFRFAPESRHHVTHAVCPFRANKRLMHRSKQQLYSITSSARARRVGDNWIPSAFATLRLMADVQRLLRRRRCGSSLRQRMLANLSAWLPRFRRCEATLLRRRGTKVSEDIHREQGADLSPRRPLHDRDSVTGFQHRRRISSILIRNTVVPIAIRTTLGSCLAIEGVKSPKTRSCYEYHPP